NRMKESDRLLRDQPWLSEVYAASVCGRLATGPEAGRRVAVGGDRVDPEGMDSSASPRCAAVAGFSLHANVAISFHDRPRLERLFRYAARASVHGPAGGVARWQAPLLVQDPLAQWNDPRDFRTARISGETRGVSAHSTRAPR